MTELNFLDKLAQLRATHCDRMPTPEMAVLTRATARLRRSGILQRCLQARETAPDFGFIDHSNQHNSLYKLLRQGPVVINFFRGFWCMYCKSEFEAFTSIQSELESLGCQYLAVSPQKVGSEMSSAEHYEVIFDRNNQIAEMFGIVYTLGEAEIELFQSWNLKIDEVNESKDWTLPIPATYIIAPDRTVAYKFADVDIRSRCCPEQLIEELQNIQTG